MNDKNNEFENIIYNEFKNIDENIFAIRIKHDRDRIMKYSAKINQIVFNVCFVFNGINTFQSSSQFQTSWLKKITKLLKIFFFEIIHHKNVFINTRIFNFRFVDEIKHSGIDKTFEKFQLIIQTYNDMKKNLVLTQTFTIQWISQQLIVCLTAVLQNGDVQLYLQNIIQMYIQLKSSFNRDFYIRLSQKLIALLKINSDCILKIIKFLYEVFETNNYWFVIYQNHYINKLNMMQSIYNFCLLYKSNPFDIVKLQIDDTLLLIKNQFANAENEIIKFAKIMIKNRECLTKTKSIKFNDTLIELIANDNLMMIFNMQMFNISFIKNLETLMINSRNIIHTELTSKNQYVAHWAKNVYIVSICQFEISFDLFFTVQTIQSIIDDIIALNKCLQWQLNNSKRKLIFVKFNHKILQLMMFTNFLFANNQNFFLQIKYVICFTNVINKTNIIYWLFIKCKKVIRSILAIKLYEIMHEFDLNAIIKNIFTKIMQTDISLIFYINSKSLYECLIKFNITQKKHLMINIMNLRQSYKKQKIIEIKWIHKQNNSADSMTKTKSNIALKTIIKTNHINLNTIEWIKKTKTAENEKKHEILKI